MLQRLQKILAEAGVASRRASEALIKSGAVSVNGKIITTLGEKADDEKDEICVNGKPIKKVSDKIYILLNKPVGYTCTRSDPHAKHTVLDLIRTKEYLYPVGRLDVDTSGIIILTNDGEFTHLMTHPSYGVNKTYHVVSRGQMSPTKLSRLSRGVKLEDGTTAPAKARLIRYSQKDDESTVEMTIHEGKKRQIRRMFENIGSPVISLKRVKFGDLDLNGIDEGNFRRLTPAEVKALVKMARRQ